MLDFGQLVTDPFPHSASAKALRWGWFRRLRKQFPHRSHFYRMTEKNRVTMSHTSEQWKAFMRTSTAWSEFYQSLAGIGFYDQVMEHLEPSFQEFGFKGVGFHELFMPDLYFFYGDPGYSCPIHMDSGTRIFSMMLYFDDCDGGDVVVYTPDKNPARMIMTAANTVAFWASCNHSWHGVLPVKSGIRRSAYISLRAKHVVWDGQVETPN